MTVFLNKLKITKWDQNRFPDVVDISGPGWYSGTTSKTLSGSVLFKEMEPQKTETWDVEKFLGASDGKFPKYLRKTFASWLPTWIEFETETKDYEKMSLVWGKPTKKGALSLSKKKIVTTIEILKSQNSPFAEVVENIRQYQELLTT